MDEYFATHGELAGQLEGTNEPGVILTPPKTATKKMTATCPLPRLRP